MIGRLLDLYDRHSWLDFVIFPLVGLGGFVLAVVVRVDPPVLLAALFPSLLMNTFSVRHLRKSFRIIDALIEQIQHLQSVVEAGDNALKEALKEVDLVHAQLADEMPPGDELAPRRPR